MDKTAELALETESILRDYLRIQNGLFRFSFKKALGLTRPDPMEAFKNAGPLAGRLESVRQAVKAQDVPADSDEGRFLSALGAYAGAMAEAVRSFRELCLKLHEHEKDRHYRKNDYPGDMARFQAMETEYLRIGLKLNELKKPLAAARRAEE